MYAGASPCAFDTGLQRAMSKAEAEAWQERLRVVQEALTLLRGLSVQPLLKDLVFEDHMSSAASTRAYLVAAGIAPPPVSSIVCRGNRQCARMSAGTRPRPWNAHESQLALQ